MAVPDQEAEVAISLGGETEGNEAEVERDRDERERNERDRHGDRDRDRERPPPPREDKKKEEGFGLRVPDIKKEEGEEEVKEKEGINLGLSGALTKDVNTFNGIVIKYAEPPEARIPKRRWRFYVFKGDEVLPTLHIHRQSAYLVGRDRKVCDLPVDHPSCSKQHAALQYRLISKKKNDGSEGSKVLPYIIDLGSSNGTFLNNTKIEAKRYYELKEKDVLKFGFSTREYVLLHENSGEDD